MRRIDIFLDFKWNHVNVCGHVLTWHWTNATFFAYVMSRKRSELQQKKKHTEHCLTHLKKLRAKFGALLTWQSSLLSKIPITTFFHPTLQLLLCEFRFGSIAELSWTQPSTEFEFDLNTVRLSPIGYGGGDGGFWTPQKSNENRITARKVKGTPSPQHVSVLAPWFVHLHLK